MDVSTSFRRCSVEGCNYPNYSGGFCQKHNYRVKKYGSIDLPPRKTAKERFLEKVNKDGPMSESLNTPCWVWLGSITKQGYGNLGVSGQTILAHRFSYELFSGPIPESFQIDHLCRYKPCVNPDHLEAVTQQVNVARWAQTRTHCVRGHEFDGVGKDGYRTCSICKKIRWQKFLDNRRKGRKL